MINSAISSAHHYYVVFLSNDSLRSIDSIPRVFGLTRKSKDFQFDNTGMYCHFQVRLSQLYGSEMLLRPNSSVDDNEGYYYDFYCGEVDSSRRIFFVCYPYSQMANFVDKSFLNGGYPCVYHKVKVNDVLKYMKNRSRLSKVEKSGLSIDITKYSAEIKDEANAKRVNLLGDDPLNSRVYDKLIEADFKIETTALKLSCRTKEIGEMELSLDRLGNYRFYIRKHCQDSCVPMLPFVYDFLKEIKGLEESSFINRYTNLDDEY